MTVIMNVRDGIADIQLARPDKRNAMTRQMYRRLGESFISVRDDPHVRVALIRGSTPDAFCAGADLEDVAPDLIDGHHDVSAWDDAHLKHVDLFKPVIAAVDGYCLGGGFEILLATDIRIAARTAQFGLPEPKVGMVPAGGSLAKLVRQIPYAHAMNLLLTGRRIDAAEALSIGLVSEVVEPSDLLPTARDMAAALTRLSQRSLEVIKEAVLRLSDLPQSAALHAEALYGQKAFTSPEAAEGVAAFRQGRAPRFPGTEEG
ncbi:enoyl-CoA hydratase/isomerase family protein [Spirillospora sp. NPDC048911]|uniref:enoyl-CoA hydratase/isomerase family protein n=1 Tax=Spirillospora sp. NPDC048911 TaxID=3364527 RepID=UPI0037208CF0